MFVLRVGWGRGGGGQHIIEVYDMDVCDFCCCCSTVIRQVRIETGVNTRCLRKHIK